MEPDPRPDVDPTLADLRENNRRAIEAAASRGIRRNPRIAEAVAAGRLK